MYAFFAGQIMQHNLIVHGEISNTLCLSNSPLNDQKLPDLTQ